MHATWRYADGHLSAQQVDGTLLGRWQAVEALGEPLADLLNQMPDLSRALLPPTRESQP